MMIPEKKGKKETEKNPKRVIKMNEWQYEIGQIWGRNLSDMLPNRIETSTTEKRDEKREIGKITKGLDNGMKNCIIEFTCKWIRPFIRIPNVNWYVRIIKTYPSLSMEWGENRIFAIFYPFSPSIRQWNWWIELTVSNKNKNIVSESFWNVQLPWNTGALVFSFWKIELEAWRIWIWYVFRFEATETTKSKQWN